MWPASRMGPSSLVAAVRITASYPRPPVAATSARTAASPDSEVTVAAPKRVARAQRGSDRVDAGHLAAGGAEQLHGDLSEQPQAYHRDSVAEYGSALPDPLHGDGADGRERRLVEADVCRAPARTGCRGRTRTSAWLA